MAKIIDVVKEIIAGDITVYSGARIPKRNDSAHVRAKKKEVSTLGRRLSNHRTMVNRLWLLMAANFKLTDFFLTLTFADAYLPQNRDEVMDYVDKFVRRLRAQRALRGQVVCYIYSIENKHGDGRYHIHMVLNSTGKDVEDICSLWSFGSVEWEYIGWSKENGKLKARGPQGYKILARYMTKEVQPVGARNYITSRNLVRPTVTVRFMSEDEVNALKLNQTPIGCVELENVEYRNEWGRFWYVEHYNNCRRSKAGTNRPGLYDGEAEVILRDSL